MKTIRKSQYLWLKLKEKFVNERQKTIEIEDEEYDNLMTNNHEIISINNIKGLYLNDHYNPFIINATDNNIIYDICTIDSDYELHVYFILEYTDGTFIGLPTSLIKFRLKNNIGELILENSDDSKYHKYLSYKSPELIEDEYEEQIIASYKGYECICKQINIKQNNYLWAYKLDYLCPEKFKYPKLPYQVFNHQTYEYETVELYVVFNDIFEVVAVGPGNLIYITLPKLYLHNHNNIDREIEVNPDNFYFYYIDGETVTKEKLITAMQIFNENNLEIIAYQINYKITRSWSNDYVKGIIENYINYRDGYDTNIQLPVDYQITYEDTDLNIVLSDNIIKPTDRTYIPNIE